MAEARKPFHEVVAEKLIEQLKEGTAPWQKPWAPGEPSAFIPMNPTTGKRYKGINAILLMSQGRTDQRWMTYKQAAAIGAQVNKGERGTPIQHWRFSEEQQKLDANGKPVRDSNGQPVMETVNLERPRAFFATVFNAEQIEGLPPLQPRQTANAWEASERAERILKASGAVIKHGEQDRAFYRPATDSIHLPDQSQFPTADNYYATALHELGHWTGHESRLDRDLANPFGSVAYAKEELRAEIASMILGDEIGIGHDPGQHVAYVKSWIQVLQEDPMEIVRAASDAEKIQDHVLGLERQYLQAQEAEAQQTPEQRFARSIGRLTDRLEESGVMQRPDAVMASAWRDLHAGSPASYDGDLEAFNEASQKAFGFVVPPSWNGVVQVTEANEGVHPVFAYVGGDAVWQSLEAYPTLEAAEAVVDRLEAVAAYGEVNEAERAYKLARLNESRVARDPNRTDEQLQAAKQAREDADMARSSGHERPQRAPAFLDTLSQPRDSQTGDVLPGDWTGLAEGNDKFWYIGREGDERSFTLLNAKTLDDAQREAITVATLSVDIEAALLDPSVTFEHYGSFKGESLDQAMRSQALTTVFNVTGSDPAQFESTAHTRLSSVFGIAEDHEQLDNAYLERKGLAQHFASHAEILHAQAARIAEEQIRGYRDSTDDERTAAKEARKEAEMAMLNRASSEATTIHFMTYAEFAGIAAATPLENHGRKWSVEFEGRALGFSDADDQAGALREVHRRQVNNALATHTGNPHDLPPAHVLNEYPELMAKFADVLSPPILESRAPAFGELGDGERPPAAVDQAPSKRVFINVPFKEKNEAKALGARWDRGEQSWYVPNGVDASAFEKWTGGNAPESKPAPQRQQPTGQADAPRVYLAVPYEERALAKQAGALWDRAATSWYIGPQANPANLERWSLTNATVEQGPPKTPIQEFADAMLQMQLTVPEGHPIMDGRRHRVPVLGDKKGETAGFYVGHLDGHPAGYICNNMTGQDQKWKSKGYTLPPEERARMIAEAATKLAARASAEAALHVASAERIAKRLDYLIPATETPYQINKGIQAHHGAFTDDEGKTTYIPAIDTNNRVWTMQYIQEDGTKRFAKDSRKEGCFHAIGGLEALAQAPVIVIAEGYATAATIAEVLGHSTVAAFDSGNLKAVAESLKQAFPEKAFVIAGDDDQAQVLTLGGNPGRSKAEEAAAAIGGKAMLPIFAPGEGTYPKKVEPVTPESFKAHKEGTQLLSDEQLEGLAAMKRFTDFNDLATKSVLGREGVDRQVRAVIEGALMVQTPAADRSRDEAKQQVIEPPKRKRTPSRAAM